MAADHPGWRLVAMEWRRVLADEQGNPFEIRADVHGSLRYQALTEQGFDAPRWRAVRWPRGLAGDVPPLAEALSSLGHVVRVANPSIWDALATAIVRQVVRARQATALYRSFSAAFGRQVEVGAEPLRVFPSADVILGLADEQFASCGMAFKRRPLRAAAEAYCKHVDSWLKLAPADLVVELQRIPSVGDWTARAAVADWSNDYSHYPFGDLAVRTWAAKAAPGFAWPLDEAEFAHLWRQMAGDHLAELTLFTLTWGLHHGAQPALRSRG